MKELGKEFSVEELERLVKCVAESGVGELLFENDGAKVRIKNWMMTESCGQTDRPVMIPAAKPAPEEKSAFAPDITTVPAGEGKCVTSPLVGTFYASSGPDKDPFVRVGQRIKKGDVLFIVESMKVMNEVPAEQDGVVAEIMVDNGQPVEYGQPVLRLE